MGGLANFVRCTLRPASAVRVHACGVRLHTECRPWLAISKRAPGVVLAHDFPRTSIAQRRTFAAWSAHRGESATGARSSTSRALREPANFKPSALPVLELSRDGQEGGCYCRCKGVRPSDRAAKGTRRDIWRSPRVPSSPTLNGFPHLLPASPSRAMRRADVDGTRWHHAAAPAHVDYLRHRAQPCGGQ